MRSTEFYIPCIILSLFCILVLASSSSQASKTPVDVTAAVHPNVRYSADKSKTDVLSDFRMQSLFADDDDISSSSSDEEPRNENSEIDEDDESLPELPVHISLSSTHLQYMKAVLTYAATRSAELYVNGAIVSSVQHYSEYRRATLIVKRGDVVAIRAHSYKSWHGVIATIQINNHVFVTGRHSFTAVTRTVATIQHTEKIWYLPGVQAPQLCQWPKPVVERRPKDDVFSKSFPYGSNGAKYVWAKGGNFTDDMFLRYVIGGQQCSSRAASTKTPTPTPTSSPQVSLNQGFGDKCNCSQVDSSKGDCFEFTTFNARLKRGVCTLRDCVPKFECTANGVAGSPQCIRRYAHEEIQFVKKRADGRLICKNEILNPPNSFYVPYV